MAKKGERKLKFLDDLSVGSDEKLWRLIHPDYWRLDSLTGKPDKQALLRTFSGQSQVSALRPSLLEQPDPIGNVKRVKPGYGIGEVTVSEIRKPDIHENVILIVIEQDPDWNEDAHVVIYRGPKGNTRLNSTQIDALTNMIVDSIVLLPDATKLLPKKSSSD